MEAEISGLELSEKVNETLEINETKADFNQEPEDDDFLPPESKPPKHPFQCEVCDKILTTKQSLKLHALTHVDPANRKTFRCEICETTFKSQPGLNYHLETKHNPDYERKKLPCPTCGRIFKSDEGRKIHMTIQHGAGGPIFKCKECPMVFARKPHLELHMATHGAGQHVCTICGKSYARLKDLSLHEATCGVKELCCAVCGKQFRKEQALENHRKKCRQESRNYRCLTCGQGFASEQALKTHEAVHRRTFRCSECSQTFVTVLALRNHEQTKHWDGFGAGVGEKRGRPKKSGSGGGEDKVRMRRSKYDLFIGLEHLADPSTLIEEEKPVKDELKPADLDPKRFPCEHCPLKFATKQALQNHAQRRHWEALGLVEPAPEKRGRKRTRPLVRVSKKRPLEPVSRKRVRRPRKLVNYVELVDLPEMVECDAAKEEDGPVKSEVVENVVIPANVAYAEEQSAPIEQVEESDIFAVNEVIIKEEIVGFEDYEFDYFENDSAGGDEPVDELTFENIITDLELPRESTNDEVDTLAVEPELENNVSEEPHISKELVIRLEKLDYSALVESSNGKKHFNRKECEHCGKAFVRQYDLAKHRVREHGSTETPTRTKPPPKMTLPPSYRCEECDKSYQLEHYLKAHNEKVHGITEEPGDGAFIRSCKHCGQKLKSWPSLVKHLKFFHAESIDESQFVKCPSCPAKFLNQEDLDGHVCTKRDVCEREPRERSFKCDLCRKTYSFLLHLEAHYSVHPEYQNFKCDHCSDGFYNERELNKHKRNAHEPVVKPAVTKIRPFKSKYKNPFPRTECEQCGQTFAYRYRLALHRIKEHGSTEVPVANRPAASATLPRNFPCDQCDKSYHLQTNLMIHKAKVHGVGEAPPKYHPTKILKHTCKHCKKQFTAWGALIYHRKYIHGESIEKTQFVQCPSCRLKLATDEEMANHVCLRGIIRERERPFKCNLCDKSYFAKPHLEGHYSVHPEYHNFKCDQCSKGFFAESELVSHKKKAHIAKELYYACETCNQLFKSQQNLKRHRELHMGREYCCEHCGKKFKMRTNLKSHVFHVHAEYASEAARAAQAIPCTVCGKTLRGTSAFKQHMRTHNNDRRYKCSFPSCGKSFIASGSLKVHVQSHTKDYKYKCKFCEYGTVLRKRIVLHEQREHNHNRFAGVDDSQ